MAKTVIGRLSALLSINNKDFNRGLKESQTKFGRFAKGITRAVPVVAAIGTALAGATVALGFWVRNQVTALDVTVKFAQRLGIATGELQALQFAGKMAGVEASSLSVGLQRMTRRVAEAAQGTGEAKAAIAELGLDARKLARLPIEQQFLKISEAMEAVAGRGNQVRLAFKLFDTEGVALINLMDLSASRIAKIREFAIAVGAAITQKSSKAIADTADAMEMASIAWQGLKNNLTVALAPIIKQLSLDFADWVKDSNNLDQLMGDVASTARTIADAFERIGSVFDRIERVYDLFRGKTVFGIPSVLTPAALPVAAVIEMGRIDREKIEQRTDVLKDVETRRRAGETISNEQMRGMLEALQGVESGVAMSVGS